MNLDQALQTFVAEANELLQELEDGLLRLEADPGAAGEVVHALFRAAHTIKGSAGLFGLQDIVDFTHAVEGVLDRLRNGELSVSPELVASLLPCRDHLAALLAALDEGENAQLRAAGARLVEGLEPFLGVAPAVGSVRLPMPEPDPVQAMGGGAVASDNWHLSLRFAPDVLRNGMDPLSFLRYLGTLGELVSVTTLSDGLPPAADMDPERCYLGFEIEFRSDADKATIEDVFEFVRDGSQIHVLPPHSQLSRYMALIRALPEDDAQLGELLVRSGAITRHELEHGLALQGAERAEGDRGRPLGEILVAQRAVAPQVVNEALSKQQRAREQRALDGRLVRVQADKLDALIDLVGELVIAGAGASLLAQRRGDPVLQEATAVIGRLVEEIRDGALRLRMVEIGETFSRFQRVVRDVSLELGKEIDLVITGADTELDKSMVEKLADPLTHLVRNAIDHGIEPPQARLAAGKPARGTLRLNAYHESGSIVIEVADDGRGLDRERILAKARERGLVGAGQVLADEEVYRLIFEPGFSTADRVSNLSGRGVGMDVVKRNIEALRGQVELDSTPGQGTTMRIRLPLTLAIIDGFLVGVGKATYVIPLDMVLECVEWAEHDRSVLDRRGYIDLRGEVLPLVRLRDHFASREPPARRESVVVVQYGAQRAGLVVDGLLGESQTVIKPLGRLFAGLRGVSGSTILGSGEVALILDVPALVQEAGQREAEACQASVAA